MKLKRVASGVQFGGVHDKKSMNQQNDQILMNG